MLQRVKTLLRRMSVTVSEDSVEKDESYVTESEDSVGKDESMLQRVRTC
jgi:hypothetical protein